VNIEMPIKMFVVLATLAASLTWYGPDCTNGDPYISSWWHNELPDGAPAIVDYEYFGVATASREIPFGTQVKFTVINIPKWAKVKYGGIIGNTVIATVVDRLGDEYGEVDFDLWPAAAEVLMGRDYQEIGTVYVKAEIGDLYETTQGGQNERRYKGDRSLVGQR